MATHSSVLAWRIPETAEPGGLPSMGLHRVGCTTDTTQQQQQKQVMKKIPQVQAAGRKAGWLADKTHVNLQVLEGQGKG